VTAVSLADNDVVSNVVVGRIGRAHGVRGEVSVEVRTDDAETRFAAGSRLSTEPAHRGPLTVDAARWHRDRLLVRFREVADRGAAEKLRGTLLNADPATSSAPTGPDEFWDHQLIGLAAVSVDGAAIGTVAGVLHSPGGAVLAVRRRAGGEVLVPFVAAIVPEVDLVAGRLVVDPPPGLLEI
jgi:16S rRNA processing protein RimM